MASAKPLRDNRARRWCTRAIVVLGGAVAGTAAAWAFSATGAIAAESDGPSWSWASERADEVRESLKSEAKRVADGLRGDGKPSDAERPSSKRPPAEADAEAGRETESDPRESTGSNLDDVPDQPLDGVSALLDHLLGPNHQPPDSGENPFDCEGEFAADFCERIEDWFKPGELPELPDVDPDGPDTPAPGFPAIHQPADIAGPAIAGPAAMVGAGEGDSGTSERGSPVKWTLATTDFPGDGIPMRMPAGAPVAPSTAGAGTAGASNADGSPQAITAVLGRALAADEARRANTGAATAPVEPGRQPGVTPD